MVAGARWRVWELKGEPRAVRDAMAERRRYRLHLHREIALRMHPELISKASLMLVRPLNGDFLDVRRENLEITVKPRARGRVRRPAGWATGAFTGTGRKPKRPPAWSRAGCSRGAVQRDGAAGG